ncbi:MAG TPA: hypothetical protein VN493_14370 [Thermoanaerobaculia bacterium]|nr:hypothetical protein [Thermoanaerobaculia bacterium]
MKAVLAVCLALVAVPVVAAALPEISFEPEAVVARGIAPKGQVVWFSVAREISRQSTTIVPRHETRMDDDGDGTVRLELGQEVPLRSIWFAVDLATGETAVATPEGFPLLNMDLPGRAIPAALNRLDLERRSAYLLLVRPGVGAWQLRSATAGNRTRTASRTAGCARPSTAWSRSRKQDLRRPSASRPGTSS